MTNDGCPVELYPLLPPAGEPEAVHAAIEAGAEVLDLGAGTGRIAHGLIELGHPVVAVDDSAAMLGWVRGARTVCSRIEDLRLGRRFPAVLLASHLINNPDRPVRTALLDTVRGHLAPGGKLVAQWHPPEWFDLVGAGGDGRLGPVRIRLRGITRTGDLLSATVYYEVEGRSWEQPFTCLRLSEDALLGALAGAGLAFAGWASADRTWFTAVPS